MVPGKPAGVAQVRQVDRVVKAGFPLRGRGWGGWGRPDGSGFGQAKNVVPQGLRFDPVAALKPIINVAAGR